MFGFSLCPICSVAAAVVAVAVAATATVVAASLHHHRLFDSVGLRDAAVSVGSSAGMENDDHAGVGAAQGMCNVADDADVKLVRNSDAIFLMHMFYMGDSDHSCPLCLHLRRRLNSHLFFS